MSADISYAQVAFDFLANEFVELVTAFARRDAQLGEAFLQQSQDRLATQFEGLRDAFRQAGLESQYNALLTQAKTVVDSVMDTARGVQAQKPQ